MYEGIKKKILESFEDRNQPEVFLCSTLHRDNLSSKYVSEFFGLVDSLFVKRRQGRNREVHICRIDKQNYKDYLKDIEEKLAVLYGYNPQNINIPTERKIQILDEQIKYEQTQCKALNLNKKAKGNYTKRTNLRESKVAKIERLKKQRETYVTQLKNAKREEREC